MNNQESRRGVEGAASFRDLVGDLIKESSLFQFSQQRSTLGGEYTEVEIRDMENERTAVIDAIEKNEIAYYLDKNFGPNPSTERIDATDCLIHIFDELKKEEPDQDFIASTIEQLKEYL